MSTGISTGLRIHAGPGAPRPVPAAGWNRVAGGNLSLFVKSARNRSEPTPASPNGASRPAQAPGRFAPADRPRPSGADREPLLPVGEQVPARKTPGEAEAFPQLYPQAVNIVPRQKRGLAKGLVEGALAGFPENMIAERLGLDNLNQRRFPRRVSQRTSS